MIIDISRPFRVGYRFVANVRELHGKQRAITDESSSLSVTTKIGEKRARQFPPRVPLTSASAVNEAVDATVGQLESTAAITNR